MVGVDITTAKELLGHMSLVMTLRYAHLAPAHKVNVLAILDGAMNRQSTKQKLYTPPYKHPVVVAKWPKKLARLARLERAASCLEGSCSIHLSYRRVVPV